MAAGAFDGADIAYAQDDGMPFPDWSPPLLTADEAAAGYAAGERVAVIAGDPANPVAGLVLDRGNARLALRQAEPALQVVYSGDPLSLADVLWMDGAGRQCWGRRVSDVQVRVARRPAAALVWVEELLAHRSSTADEPVDWPAFGDWPAVAAISSPPWSGPGDLDLIDADGWLLDAWEACGVTQTWRELGKRYDAPRAFGLPPDVQAKLAEPLGWQAAGRRWRLADEVRMAAGGSGAVIVTDAMFAAGAGASGEIVTTVTSGEVQIVLGLPVATARLEIRRGERLGSPSYPRPSTGAQVAVTAMLEAGTVAHQAVVEAVRDGRLPPEWAGVFG